MTEQECKSRIENKSEVEAYLAKIKYALGDSHTKINFQPQRGCDALRDEQYTNGFTVHDLFPNDDPKVILRQELLKLDAENYKETVKDINYPAKSEMRVYGRNYNGKDVYIKVRAELMDGNAGNNNTVLVMSFHYAEHTFTARDFPYKK